MGDASPGDGSGVVGRCGPGRPRRRPAAAIAAIVPDAAPSSSPRPAIRPPAAAPRPRVGGARHRRPGVRAAGRSRARRRRRSTTAAYRPALAASWERVDSLTWRFHLRPGARWQDGQPVTSEDVRFSFEAFSRFRDRCTGAALPRPASPWCRRTRPRSSSASPRRPPSSSTTPPSTSASSRATSGPRTAKADLGRRHVAWRTSSGAAPIGSRNGSAASSCGSRPTRPAGAAPPPIRRAIWRFAPDPDAALNLVLSHEADLLETAGSPDAPGPRRARHLAAPRPVRLGRLRIPRVPDRRRAEGRAAPDLSDAPTRRALALAVDRRTLARSVFGQRGKGAARADVAAALDLDDSIRLLPFDTVQADRALDAAGWRRPGQRDHQAARQPRAHLRHSRAQHQRVPPPACRRDAGDVAGGRRRR